MLRASLSMPPIVSRNHHELQDDTGETSLFQASVSGFKCGAAACRRRAGPIIGTVASARYQSV